MPKLPKIFLEKFISDVLKDTYVIKGPEYGEDAAVIYIGSEYLVIHPDPISGAVKNIGWLGINVPSNDIAVTGARPRWALPTIQFPDDFSNDDITSVLSELKEAAEILEIGLIGGHTELVNDLDRPLITTTVMGLTDRPVFTSGSNPGDTIVQIGGAGIEGTWILACEYGGELIEMGVSPDVIKMASQWRNHINIVEDALEIADIATSMHDATEGGILQCLYEMAVCSSNRFVVDKELWFKEETKSICGILDLDPKRLISSGCFIATFPKNIKPTLGHVIGRVEEGEGELIYNNDIVEEETEDELFKAVRNFNP